MQIARFVVAAVATAIAIAGLTVAVTGSTDDRSKRRMHAHWLAHDPNVT